MIKVYPASEAPKQVRKYASTSDDDVFITARDFFHRNKDIRQEVMALRSEHLTMQYCFTDAEFEKALGKLSTLIEK